MQARGEVAKGSKGGEGEQTGVKGSKAYSILKGSEAKHILY